MKKMKITIYTTTNEPEDIRPFSMIFGSAWKAYDAGELTPEKILLLAVLYRQVNPYEGIGRTSYEKICVMLKRKTSQQNINGINKLMADLKDGHELIWFPNHSGSKDFSYVVADFKIAKKPNETTQKWIDIKPYFQSQKQSESSDKPPPIATIQSEAQPRLEPPVQRSERSNSEEITSIKEELRKRWGRPPQTNTD
ncbi:MAG: hypothetical protein A2418_02195 [Candidatus Brennerbacteria bacterium RIFOXYC1_FULL_41_11]|nr:MAG: hypothetical protein A2418_02195 [Candidatus Brennerbacteria bacterium RIFOXYC1_FULL_41_11]